MQNDQWNVWHVSRPFNEAEGARKWLKEKIEKLKNTRIDSQNERHRYRDYMRDLQQRIGETVILNYSQTGFCSVFYNMGLELFCYFNEDYPGEMVEYMEASVKVEVDRVHAVADKSLKLNYQNTFLK